MADRDEARLGWVVENWTPPPRPAFEVLSGRWCRLEPLSAARHAADIHAVNRASDAIWDWLPYGPFDTEAAYADWVRSVEGRDDPMFFAVIEAGSGRAQGVLSLMRIDTGNGVIEVGHINFAPVLQRTPAATEAIFLLMARIFRLGYRRFEWKCNALNQPSRRAAERFGFSYEGVFRQAVVSKGRNRDTAWFAMIDADWPDLATAYGTWLAPENFDAAGRQVQSLSRLTRPVLSARDPMRQG
jgi:RimJ/RimL family protein N-acetyltransferase